jgi:hypothetical protein
MKFLAWDVGIKNLAYSIIDFDKDNNTKSIIDWGVINLMNEVDEKPKEIRICCENNVSGGKCKTKAIYIFSKDSTRGLCRKHQQMIKYAQNKFLDISEKSLCCYETGKIKRKIKKEDDENKTKDENENADEKDEKKTCEKTALYARKDDLSITYCSMHLKMLQKKETVPFEIYELKKDQKEMVRAQSVLTLAKRLYQHLENIEEILLDVEEVIIENQPVLKNPTMKTIQILLYGWFIMNGILTERIKGIHFFSASKKLEAYDDVDNKIAKTLAHITGQYQVNKKLAILYTVEMIKNDTKWFKFFSGHQKRDDLADAYLTNCYYIDREFKINKFAPKTKKEKEKEKKTNSNTKTKTNTNELGDEDDNIPDSVFIKDSDDEDVDGKEDKFSKLFPDLFGDKIDLDMCMGFGEDEGDGEEEEDDVIEKKPFKKFYKNYYNQNKYQNKSSNESKTTLISNIKKKPFDTIVKTSNKNTNTNMNNSISDMAKVVPKKKVVGGLDNFFM